MILTSTMAIWTQAQITALQDAIASGILTVTYTTPNGTRTITYQSLAQMRDLLAEMTVSVGNAPAYRFAATRKGV